MSIEQLDIIIEELTEYRQLVSERSLEIRKLTQQVKDAEEEIKSLKSKIAGLELISEEQNEELKATKLKVVSLEESIKLKDLSSTEKDATLARLRTERNQAKQIVEIFNQSLNGLALRYYEEIKERRLGNAQSTGSQTPKQPAS